MPATPIAHKEAYQLWSQLEAEFDRFHAAIEFIPISQSRLQDDLRRYLCLRCAGFLERIVFECTNRYLAEVSSGPGLEFAKSFFSTAPNLNPVTFRRLMERFGEDHATRFDEFLTATRKDRLEDLASVRNPIAHGNVTGGRKLDPMQYKKLCHDVYVWLVGDLLTPLGVVLTPDDGETSVR